MVPTNKSSISIKPARMGLFLGYFISVIVVQAISLGFVFSWGIGCGGAGRGPYCALTGLANLTLVFAPAIGLIWIKMMDKKFEEGFKFLVYVYGFEFFLLSILGFGMIDQMKFILHTWKYFSYALK